MGYKLKRATIWRDTTRLPSAYQEVEYIQSSGTQYFIVGTSFKTSYKSVIDLEMVVTGGDYIPLGVHNDAGKRYGIDAYGGKFTVISGGGSWTNTATEDTNRHLITIDKTTATVDGTSYSISYVDYTYNKGVGVFGYHNTQTDGVNYKSSNKLYKLDIYDENGTHIYDLVPCYRKLDSVIGMYDLVNGVFYTNSGSGTFTKGSDVGPTEIKVRPSETVLFDFGDWTNSGWTAFGTQGTVTKSSSQITFSNSSSFSQNYLSQFEIDGTKDFLLEFTANIPNTAASFHYFGVGTTNDAFGIFLIGTTYRSGERNNICTKAPDGDWVSSGEANNGTKDFFMRKVGTTLTMGWDGVVKRTDSNFTTTGTWYFGEQVYRNTITLYTAKLTYL